MENPNPKPPITIASAIHKIQSSLIQTPSASFDLLIAASTLLSKHDYDDVVTERTISDLCGYPLCPNPLPSPSDRQRKGKYRVSLREHKVYDLNETYSYCRDECLIGSRALKGSMSDERRSGADVRKKSVEKVLRLFGELEGEERDEEVKKGEGLRGFKLEIKEKEGVRVGDVRVEEWIGPSNAIEGYVPQLYSGSKSTLNSEYTEANFSAIKDEVESYRILQEEPSGLSDTSEIIAKKLEDVILSEKKVTAEIKPSKFKPKIPAKTVNRKSEKLDNGNMGFTSSIIFGGEFDSTLPNTCSATIDNASELIAKQLEEVVIAEKMVTRVGTSTASKHKPRRKGSNDKSDKMDSKGTKFDGSSVIAVSPSSSLSSQFSSKQSARASIQDGCMEKSAESVNRCNSEDGFDSEDIDSKKKAVLRDTGLKSSLKTAGSKGLKQSVKWEDQRNSEAEEGKKDMPQVMQEEDTESSLRVASAEACAAALSQAAEAVASGAAEAGDAVSEAGILILPQPENSEEDPSKADEEAFELDREIVKWPKKNVLLDTDMFDVEDSWHDTPPEGFSLTLSSFGTMWMTLFGWITCSSLAYIYGHDESSHENFLSVNGREYPQKIYIRGGKSAEIRLALDGFVVRALPGLIMDLRLPTPLSTLEKFMGRLLGTMSFVDPVPSFRIKQWQVLLLLFIEALSVHRLPSLAPQITRNMLQHKVLASAHVTRDEYDTMRDLILPLGRLPQFSSHSGG